MAKAAPLVGIIMGSQSDWETMRHAAETLDALGVAHEARIVSAHRTPERLYDYARRAARPRPEGDHRRRRRRRPSAGHDRRRMTPLPVFGVPVESNALKGMDSLLSIVQMPAGIPVGTLAIGEAGAINAALLAAAVLALQRQEDRQGAGCAAGATDRGGRR